MGKTDDPKRKDHEEIEKYKEERRQKKIQNKILGKKLGNNSAICNHLDVYSSSFKELLNEITDENIKWTQMGKVVEVNTNAKMDELMTTNENPEDRKTRL